MHIQIEAANRSLAVHIKHIKYGNIRMPARCSRFSELNAEQFRSRIQHPALHLRVGEIWPYRLRIESKGLTPVLFIPVAAAGCVHDLEIRLLLLRKLEHHTVFALSASAAGLFKPAR